MPTQPGTDQQQQAAYMSYYPPNAQMSYPFMNQAGPTISEGAWSNGTADPNINFLGGYGQMGADYMNNGNAMFGGFSGYQPGFSWEFPGAGDYSAWGAPPTGTAPAPSGPAPSGLAPTGPAPGGPVRKDDRMVSHQYHTTSAGEYYIPTQPTDHHAAVGYGASMATPGLLNGSEMERDIKAVDHALKVCIMYDWICL